MCSISNSSLNDNIKIELELIEHTGEILHDIHNGKEVPWKKHKVSSLELAELFKLALLKDETLITDTRLYALSECGSFLLFDRNAEQLLRLRHANFCHNRLCVMCNWRKSKKLNWQVNLITTELWKQEPTARFLFVTLTVPNCKAEDLKDTINKMNKAFSYLTSKNRNFAPAKKFKENLLGYMKAMEITYNQQTDTYHPHIHCLFPVKSNYFGRGYIKKNEWQAIWSKAMKSDRELIVHVQTIKNSTAKAIAEVAKYPVKPTDLLSISDKDKATDALIVLHRTLKGRRLVTFGGLMATIKHQLNLKDVEDDDNLIHTDSEDGFNPIEQVLYRWNFKLGVYIC